jgi:thioredoxin-related protein
LGTSSTLLADEWGSAIRRAKKEDKPLILYFFSTYCPHCLAMDQEVLADREISTSLKNKAIYLRINADKRDDLVRFYSVRGYPTTSFLEPSGQRIIQIPGYIEKRDFNKVLAYTIGKHYRTMRLRDFLKR